MVVGAHADHIVEPIGVVHRTGAIHYFEDKAQRSALTERLGFEIIRPRLALVLGRFYQPPAYVRRAPSH